MTNDQNNINELVTPDDDPTAELEALVFNQYTPSQHSDSESDANTFDYTDTVDDVGVHDAGIAELQSELRSRSETIEQLQFDVEQFRSKCLGLEAEIKARENATKSLNRELDEALKSLARRDKQLKKYDQSIQSLKADIKRRNNDYKNIQTLNVQLQAEVAQRATIEETLTASAAETAKKTALLDAKLKRLREEHQQRLEKSREASREVKELRAALCDSKQTVAELQHYVDGRRSNWDILRDDLRTQKAAIDQFTAEQKTLRSETEQRREDIEKLKVDLESRNQTIRNLQRENERQQRDLDTSKGEDTKSTSRLFAEQAGQLASSEMTIEDLRNQFDRTENYADSMRRQLQDLIAYSDASRVRQEYLQQSLQLATEQITALHESLDDERRISCELNQELGETQESHEQEVRKIRFELGEAEETVAQSSLISQQLASDLTDTREYREQLEIMLGDSEQQSNSRIDDLTRQIRTQEREIEAYEQKLETKSAALTCLLAELTKKNQQTDSIGEIELVVDETDNRRSERIKDHPVSDRDRVTRVLVGSIDGQELRFPLFKNRLTIGRTQQNDIQIKAPYISRRHAVIVVDGDSTRIVDWGSKNGVCVNASGVTEQFLKNGDIVTIGTADFRYEERRKRNA